MKKLVGIFGLFILIMGLVGCGSNESTSSESTEPTPETKESSEPIRMGINIWPGFMPWHVVEQEKFFEKHGVDVEIVTFPVYSDGIQAFAAGKIDVINGVLGDLIPVAQKKDDFKIISVMDISNGSDAILAKNEYTDVKQLAGKDIGVEVGSVANFLMLQMLADNGLTEKDVNVINLAAPDAGSAFISGDLDAAVTWEPYINQAIKREKGHVIFSSADVPGAIVDVLAVQDEVLERREDVKNLLNAWYEGVEYVNQNPEEATQIMADESETPVEEYDILAGGVKIFNKQESLEAFKPGDDFTSLHYTSEVIGQFMVEQGLLEEAPNMEPFLDDSILQEISQ